MLTLYGVSLSDKHVDLLNENIASKHIQFQHSKPINMDTFRLPENVDICFVELMLNNKEDFQCLKELKTSMKKDSSLVVITNQKNEKMIELAKLFADDCLQSPVELKTFKQIVVLKAKQLLMAKKQQERNREETQEKQKETTEEHVTQVSPKEDFSAQPLIRKKEKETSKKDVPNTLDTKRKQKEVTKEKEKAPTKTKQKVRVSHKNSEQNDPLVQKEKKSRHDATPFLEDDSINKPQKKENTGTKKDEFVHGHEVSESPTKNAQHVQQESKTTPTISENHVSQTVETKPKDAKMDNSAIERQSEKLSSKENTESREDRRSTPTNRGEVSSNIPHSRVEYSNRVFKEKHSVNESKSAEKEIVEDTKVENKNITVKETSTKEDIPNEPKEKLVEQTKIPKIVVPKIIPNEDANELSEAAQQQKVEGDTIPVIKPVVVKPTAKADGDAVNKETTNEDNAADKKSSNNSDNQATEVLTDTSTEDSDTSEKTVEDLKGSSQVLYASEDGVIAIEGEETTKDDSVVEKDDTSPSTGQSKKTTMTDTSEESPKYTLSEEYLKDAEESYVKRDVLTEDVKENEETIKEYSKDDVEHTVSEEEHIANSLTEQSSEEPLTKNAAEGNPQVEEELSAVDPVEKQEKTEEMEVAEQKEVTDHVVVTDDGEEFIFSFDDDDDDDEEETKEVTAKKEGEKGNFSQLSPSESNNFSHEKKSQSNPKSKSVYQNPNLMGIERKIQEMNELMRQKEQKRLEEEERIKQLEREREQKKKNLEVTQPPMHIEKPRHLENLEKKKSRRLFDMFFKK